MEKQRIQCLTFDGLHDIAADDLIQPDFMLLPVDGADREIFDVFTGVEVQRPQLADMLLTVRISPGQAQIGAAHNRQFIFTVAATVNGCVGVQIVSHCRVVQSGWVRRSLYQV